MRNVHTRIVAPKSPRAVCNIFYELLQRARNSTYRSVGRRRAENAFLHAFSYYTHALGRFRAQDKVPITKKIIECGP